MTCRFTSKVLGLQVMEQHRSFIQTTRVDLCGAPCLAMNSKCSSKLCAPGFEMTFSISIVTAKSSLHDHAGPWKENLGRCISMYDIYQACKYSCFFFRM